MAMRGSGLIPSTVTKSLICIDSLDGFEMQGRLFNPYIDGVVEFNSVFEMINVLDNFFDRMSFPQPYYQDREFIMKPTLQAERGREESEVRQYMAEDIFVNEQGKKATFVVQVQFRQNATWQGTITWTDEKRTQRFRSTLEMLKLMDSALDIGEEDSGRSGNAWE